MAPPEGGNSRSSNRKPEARSLSVWCSQGWVSCTSSGEQAGGCLGSQPPALWPVWEGGRGQGGQLMFCSGLGAKGDEAACPAPEPRPGIAQAPGPSRSSKARRAFSHQAPSSPAPYSHLSLPWPQFHLFPPYPCPPGLP